MRQRRYLRLFQFRWAIIHLASDQYQRKSFHYLVILDCYILLQVQLLGFFDKF